MIFLLLRNSLEKETSFPRTLHLFLFTMKKVQSNGTLIMALDKLEVEALKYNGIIKSLSDAKYLKIMLNVGSCYPNFLKEFVVKLSICFISLSSGVKSDSITPWLLKFSYKLFVRINILGISLSNVHVLTNQVYLVMNICSKWHICL